MKDPEFANSLTKVLEFKQQMRKQNAATYILIAALLFVISVIVGSWNLLLGIVYAPLGFVFVWLAYSLWDYEGFVETRIKAIWCLI